jgi:hypothetical protein
MKFINKLILLITCFVNIASFSTYSQNIGIGGDVLYNLQSENIGVGARISIYPNNRLSFVPEFSYYSLYNFAIPINEYTIGMALEYKFILRKKVSLYLLAHGGYNSWSNFEDSPLKDAQKSNWNGEGGIGITNSKCLRPFLEYRYNAKFGETHLRLGLLYIFGCKSKDKRGGVYNRADRLIRCAAYDY